MADIELVRLTDIEEAATRIAGVAERTPLRRAHSLSRATGVELWLKCEFQQRAGSFKIRGAYNRISRLAPDTTVVAASAGNHAQGVALACQRAGLRSVVFMPEAAPLPKVQATEEYGAEVRFRGDTVDDAIGAATEFADDTGAVFVPPFDDRHVVAGQGTLGLELADQMPPGATVVVPVGGGGLIAGVAAALAGRDPSCRVIGVEPTGAASMAASLAAGTVVALDDVATIADGVALKAPSALTLAHVQRLVHDVVTVNDPVTAEALVLLAERAKAVVEPSGALSLAAVLAGAVPTDRAVVVVLSGGNVDPLLLSKLLEHGLSAAGRYLRMTVTVPDRPGSLARLTGTLAEAGLNVLSVEHHREGVRLDMGQVEIVVTVETRGPRHRDAAIARLEHVGFAVAAD